MRLACAIVMAVGVSMPAAAATDWAGAQTVVVATSDYHFSPDKPVFKRGVAYRLRIENRGKDLHWFNAPDFFKAVEPRDPTVLNPDRTEIEIAPGEAKDFYFVPKRAGRFPLIGPDHDWTGMTGEITVE